MKPNPLPFAQKHGTTAAIVQCVLTVCALAAAIYGFTYTRTQVQNAESQLQLAQELAAQKQFADYLALAIAHPDLAAPDYRAIKGNAALYPAYEAFVSTLLNSCEAILETFPGDKAWLTTCRSHMARHAAFLCADAAHDLDAYSAAMQALIKDVATDAGKAGVPECRAGGAR